MGRGWQGAVLKALRAKDYQLTVTASEPVTEHFHRVWFEDGGLLRDHPLHPTMWVRGWFDIGDGKLQQRGYTIVEPDPAGGRFAIDFAVHDGPAPTWARAAEPGEPLLCTVMGSKFAVPEPAPNRWLLFGDAASIPAINTVLQARAEPMTVHVEIQHPTDRDIPLSRRDGVDVTYYERADRGLLAAADTATVDDRTYVWIALDSNRTRQVASRFKSAGHPKDMLHAQAYWLEPKGS